MDYSEKNAKLYIGAVTTVEQFMSGALDEKVNSEIRKRAIFGAIFMAVPLWGIEIIAYAIVLWGTYTKISNISGVPFRENFFKNVLAGFILNLVITFVLCFALDFIPVLGWVGSAIVGYLSILLSGTGYVKALKLAHGNKAKLDLNVKKGIEGIKNKTDVSASQEELNKTLGTVKRTNRFLDAVENKDVEEVTNVIEEYKSSKKAPLRKNRFLDDVEKKDVDEVSKVIEEDKSPKRAPLRRNRFIDDVEVVEDKTTTKIDSTDTKQTKSKVEHLRELKALLDEGILTQEEFNEEKKKVLQA